MSRPAAPERLALPNGLTLVFEPHAAAEVAAVQLWVRAGARDESDPESGLSHFIEHLLFKGTPRRGPGVIDETVSGLGGEMNAATSQDFTYYHVVLPARHLPTALDVLADAAMHASFDPGELERERQVVLEEIRRAEDNPSACLWRALARRHFAGHPYARQVLGTPETVGAVDREAVVGYWRRRYVPAAATVVVVGEVARDAVVDAARETFGAWQATPPATGGAGPARRPPGIERVTERRPVHQTYVGLAWSGPTPRELDVHATDVLATVLGHGRTSRLYQSLRERLRIAQGVGAACYTQHDAGTVLVTARAVDGKAEAIERAALEEVERLREELVGEDDLRRAQTAVAAGYAFGHETAEGVAYGYGSAVTVSTLEFELGYVAAVERVSPEDVRAAARRHLAPDRFTVAVLEPGDGSG